MSNLLIELGHTSKKATRNSAIFPHLDTNEAMSKMFFNIVLISNLSVMLTQVLAAATIPTNVLDVSASSDLLSSRAASSPTAALAGASTLSCVPAATPSAEAPVCEPEACQILSYFNPCTLEPYWEFSTGILPRDLKGKCLTSKDPYMMSLALRGDCIGLVGLTNITFFGENDCPSNLPYVTFPTNDWPFNNWIYQRPAKPPPMDTPWAVVPIHGKQKKKFSVPLTSWVSGCDFHVDVVLCLLIVIAFR